MLIFVHLLGLYVRRLSDTGKAWPYIFLGLISLVGVFILLYMMMDDSAPETQGEMKLPPMPNAPYQPQQPLPPMPNAPYQPQQPMPAPAPAPAPVAEPMFAPAPATAPAICTLCNGSGINAAGHMCPMCSGKGVN